MMASPLTHLGITRSERYSERATKSAKEEKRAKGVCRAVVKSDLALSKYKKCLFEQQVYECQQAVIRSKNHKLGVYHQLKTSLSPIDTKRYILDDGITTYAFGHYKIGEIELLKLFNTDTC